MTGACHLSLSRLGFHNASNVGGSAYANCAGDSLKLPSDLTDPHALSRELDVNLLRAATRER